MEKWMVYDITMLDGEIRTLCQPKNFALLEQLGWDRVNNITVWAKDEALKRWQEKTNGIIYKANDITDNNKKKVPNHLRKAGNIHKYMDWKHRNNII